MAKRIKLIVKGEGILSSLLAIREKKVNRAVESAADYAEEMKLDAQTRALKAIEALGKNADNSEGMTNAINAYCEALDDERAWNQRTEDIKNLKKTLNEEVSETPEAE